MPSTSVALVASLAVSVLRVAPPVTLRVAPPVALLREPPDWDALRRHGHCPRRPVPVRGDAPAPEEPSIHVPGGSLRTRSCRTHHVNVQLGTDGLPLDAAVELWHGPESTPFKMRAYVEDGRLRPFRAVIETPGGLNTVAVRNIGPMEYPFTADVLTENIDGPSANCAASPMVSASPCAWASS